jgi:hypothetical protein
MPAHKFLTWRTNIDGYSCGSTINGFPQIIDSDALLVNPESGPGMFPSYWAIWYVCK